MDEKRQAVGVSAYAKRFHTRIEQLQQDVEFADILAIANRAGDLLSEEGKLFRHVSKKKHPVLFSLPATSDSRLAVVQHLRVSVWSSYMKDIYEELTLYLQVLVYEAARLARTPGQARLLLADNRVSFSASEIISYADLDELIMKIAEDTIRNLDKMHSTKLLVEQIVSRLGLEVEESIIADALPYLNVRHALVHTDGRADKAFEAENPQIDVRHGRIFVTYNLTVEATRAICGLVDAIDASAVKKGILKAAV